jgi:hypothetical protein
VKANEIGEWTSGYEAWLAGQVPFVVKEDLEKKHADMAGSPFVFLRGTYYAWAKQFPPALPGLVGAPRVTAVGDLHLENFGTWRDAEGRLAWGVNDFDEASPLPYTNDLVRLATSLALAQNERFLKTPPEVLAEAFLDAYRSCLDGGGAPVLLGEERRRLREFLLRDLLRALEERARKRKKRKKVLEPREPHEVPAACLRALEQALPAGTEEISIQPRVAGVGSLGRPRFLATGLWNGAPVQREAKARVPSAAGWAGGVAGPGATDAFAHLLACAIRSPDPFLHLADGWVVRRLATDTEKIEFSAMALPGPLERELASLMGRELANVHGATAGRGRVILADLERRGRKWLPEAADVMTDQTAAAFKAWKKSRRRR